jgi:protein gp37
VNKTTIEWVRNPDGTQGYSWNPITGCLNGCEYCYARKLANTRLKHVYLANRNVEIAPGCDEADPFAPRYWHQRWFEPLMRDKPAGIFVCDMGELFGPWLPREWTGRLLRQVRRCHWHRFYLLTKQPQELVKWSPFPENAWVGVSAWDHASFINACHHLQDVKATVKYISLEPLLDWKVGIAAKDFMRAASVTWLIVGAQTKPHVMPEHEWLRSILGQLHPCDVAVFLKDSILKHTELVIPLQEMPKGVTNA